MAMLNLYQLFVEYVFGSVFIAILSLGILLWIFASIGRLVPKTKNNIIVAYWYVMLMYFSLISAMLIWVVSLAYMIYEFRNWYLDANRPT